MARYSFAELEGFWIQAGGSESLAPTMAAVALAESGGNSTSHNDDPITQDDSYGLWQINYYGSNRAPRTARYGPPEGLFDPLRNAQAAVDLASSPPGLDNWSTYKHKTYLAYLPANPPPPAQASGRHRLSTWHGIPAFHIGGVKVPELLGPAPGGIATLGLAERLYGAISGKTAPFVEDWLHLSDVARMLWRIVLAMLSIIYFLTSKRNWLRMVEFVVGAMLILYGISVFVRPSVRSVPGEVRRAARTAKQAVK